MEQAIFALGTLGFWILTGIVCLLLIAAVEYEKPGLATLSLVVTFALLWIFGDVNIIKMASESFEATIAMIACYFAVGVIWSMAQWWFFVRRCREAYDKTRAEFMRFIGLACDAPIPADKKQQWQRWHRERSFYHCYRDQRPMAKDHKSRILTWMIYWPWSSFWTIINDPVKRLFKYIFEQIKAVYQRISDSAFKDVSDDFELPSASNETSETEVD